MRELRRKSGRGGCPIRWRSVWLTACSGALAVTLAGCGGNDGETETVAGPRIERAVAERLASLSDEVAQLLEDGDTCAASQTAVQLRDELTAAINDGKVPTVYLEDLSGLTNEIELQIPACAEPSPPPDTTEEEDDEEKDKRKKDDEDDGGSTGTIPDETTTQAETETGTTTETVPPEETVPTDTTTTTTSTTTEQSP